MNRILLLLFLAALLPGACQNQSDQPAKNTSPAPSKYKKLLAKYDTFKLTTDQTKLNDNEKKLIAKLKEVARIMDDIFWYEAYGNKDSLLQSINDPDARKFAIINYGPWDRLDGNKPFIEGIGPKPPGANFYPADMTKEEFDKADLPGKESLYTMIRRDSTGKLIAIPYHQFFKEQTARAVQLLDEAAGIAQNPQLKHYLKLRARALATDDYHDSDVAWLDMKTNHIDVIVGPIETYEDQLFGYKASHACYILVKDMDWSKRLARYAKFLPELQQSLPVPPRYKKEKPGTDTELNAYDAIYYAGDCNAGSKTIAVNLPNDEKIQLAKGTRRLQLKNVMRAKFEKILVPIANVLIHPDQRKWIDFDAFFANTMFHEVAHGLGIKNTINGRGPVRKALKQHASALEEGKADMLGLFMVRQLHKKGEIKGDIRSYYTTFMASIFRSVRFGSASAHGKANMIRFNFFKEQGAFAKDPATGTYKIDFDKFEQAMDKLSTRILTLQGDGDYEAVAKLVAEKGIIGPELQRDLDRLNEAGIPVDIIFEQ